MHSSKIKYIILICAFFINSILANEQKVVLAAVENSSYENFTKEVYDELYKRIGYKVEIKNYPALRSLVYTNRGVLDGETLRISQINKKFTNLIKIPIPIFTIKSYVFSKNKNLKIDTWDSLNNYKIAIIRGIRYTELATKDKKRLIVSNIPSMIKAVRTNTADVFVYVPKPIEEYLEKNKIDDIYKNEPAITKIELFHFVHKKNKHLIPKLTKALEEMEKEGFLDKIRKKMN